jgi:hypothetical protein
MMGAELEIVVEPHSLDHDPSDARWIDALDELKAGVKAALRDEDGDLDERETDVEGHKGGVDLLVLALGSSGAITAAASAFKAWLVSGRNREIVIKRREGGRVTEVSVKTVGIGEEHLLEQLRAALSTTRR